MRDTNNRGQRGPVQKNTNEKFAINNQIRAIEVRLIDENGEQVGIVNLRDALRRADDAGLDLVEISPNAKPPVCKILDYGKLKYQEQKKAAEARKKTQAREIKELRVRYSTDKHDLEVKIAHAIKFLEHGDKVKFSMRFKGREVAYEELGKQTFHKIVEALADYAVVEELTGLMGRSIMLTVAPKSASKPVKTKDEAVKAVKSEIKTENSEGVPQVSTKNVA